MLHGALKAAGVRGLPQTVHYRLAAQPLLVFAAACNEGARTEVHGGKGDVGVCQVPLEVHAVGAVVQGVAADRG